MTEAWPFIVVFLAWGLGFALGHFMGYRRGRKFERLMFAFWSTPMTGGKVVGSLDHLRQGN